MSQPGLRKATPQGRCAAGLVPASKVDRTRRRGRCSRLACEAHPSDQPKRRDLFVSAAGVGLLTLGLDLDLNAGSAQAVQGLTAGRIPGLTPVDSEGFRTYTRPEGKSGGHGIGWSEIPTYSFRVPDGWKEEPVSIADLGGTEIDVRFTEKDQGQLAVVVAPVLRFMNVGFNADVRIEDIGSPEKVLNGFAPEILGRPVDPEDLVNEETMKKRFGPGGEELTFYLWETKAHDLLSATAFKNRVFIIALRASGRQYRAAKEGLRTIQKSFVVDTKKIEYD